MKRRAATLLTVAIAAGAGAAPGAQAATRGEICVYRAAVHDTPRGLVVGHLYDGARVRLLGRNGSRRWYRIRGPLELAGWTRTRNVCK